MFFTLGWTVHDRRFVTAVARTHDVGVVRLVPPGAGLGVQNVRCIDLAGRPRPRSFCALDVEMLPAVDAAIRDLSPDVIHAGPATSCGWLAAMVDRAPVVVSSWGYDLLEEARTSAAAHWLSGFALHHAAAIHVDSFAVRQRVVDDFGIGPEKIVQFPFGLELDAFDPSGPALQLPRPFADSVAKVILCVRAWETYYAIETVLESFEIASRARPGLGLILAGGGSRDEWVRQFVERNGLSSVVWLAGALDAGELAAAYRRADVYLSCVPSDGTSISLLEALAMGVPAAVVDNAGNREWVESGTGLLVPAGDAPAFAKAIVELAGWSSGERARCRALGRAIVTDRADWRRHVQTLLKTYAIAAGADRPCPAA